MGKILFGVQRGDFSLGENLLTALAEDGHEVVEISNADQLLETMRSGEGDLVVIFGSTAGLLAMQLAQESGCQIPAIILEPVLSPTALKLNNATILKASCSPTIFLSTVDELLEQEGKGTGGSEELPRLRTTRAKYLLYFLVDTLLCPEKWDRIPTRGEFLDQCPEQDLEWLECLLIAAELVSASVTKAPPPPEEFGTEMWQNILDKARKEGIFLPEGLEE